MVPEPVPGGGHHLVRQRALESAPYQRIDRGEERGRGADLAGQESSAALTRRLPELEARERREVTDLAALDGEHPLAVDDEHQHEGCRGRTLLGGR